MQLRLKPIVAALVFLTMAQGAQAVEVAAGELDAALRSLADETGIQILFDTNELKGARTNGVHGAATPEAALKQLLQGTGFGFQATGGRSFVIQSTHPATMDPIVVSATRTEERLSKVSASVSLVTRDDLEEQQAGTVNDVMKKLPNVDFGGGPRTDGQLPTIRGYQGNGITLLVDGARRNANYGLTSPLFIDPYFLSRAEVVRGSSSSLYGSGGNGGAMVFTTLAARDLLAAGQNFGGDVKAGYSSGDFSHRYNARIYGQNGSVDALLALGYQDFNNIRQASGTTLQLANGHGTSGLLKVGLQANDRLRLELSQQTFSKTTLEPNNPQIVTTAQTQLTHNSQDETVLKATTVNTNGEKEIEARVYSTATKNQRDKNGVLAYWNSTINTLGISVQNTTRIANDSFGNQRLTYGLDSYQDKLGTISGAAANPVNPDGKAQVTGVFLEDEIALGNAWRITPSARYDHFSASPSNAATPSSSNSHVSPKITLAWQTTSHLSLYGNYGQAYRAPTIWESNASTLAGGVYPTANFNNFAANPNLRPETVTTFEIGANFNKGELLAPDDNLKVRATAFRAKAKDMITSATIGTFTRTGFLLPGSRGSIFQNQNISKASRNGFELEGRYNLNAWQINASYSRLRVTDDTTGSSLFAPPDKLSTLVRYAIPATDMTVSWNATAVAAQNYDTTILRRRNGYTVHDLYATWEPYNQKLRVDFGIGNLFDKRYMVYQSSNALAATTYEMGTNYKVTLSASF